MIETEIEDDLTVPNETVIYYSKISYNMEIFGGLFVIGFGIYAIFIKNYAATIVSIPYGSYVLYKAFKRAKNTNPQIIINNNGIEVCGKKFSKWSTVENIEVINESTGEYRENFLRYNSHNGSVNIKIDDYDTNNKELRKLIAIYKLRNAKSNYR